ncbi:MAG: PglZ domain-containing protein [Thermodesulfobacteriota bacterium]|nr:PglZ domain-containing protein [Thermodesulfobacteriota bacterium]
MADFIFKLEDLRKLLGPSSPLNRNHILSILLAIRKPTISLQDLLVANLSFSQKVTRFLSVLYGNEMDEKDEKICREIFAQEVISGREERFEWFSTSADELAVFLVLYDLFLRQNVPNPSHQIRGLGVIGFDPDILESNASEIVSQLRLNKKAWNGIITLAEKTFPEGTIGRVVQSLTVQDAAAFVHVAVKESSPLIIYGLLLRVLEEIFGKKEFSIFYTFEEDIFSKHPILLSEAETKYSGDAKALLLLFRNILFLRKTLSVKIPDHKKLATLVDWYVKNKMYRMQLVLTRSMGYIRSIGDQDLRVIVDKYLSEEMGGEIQSVLENLDLQLFALIDHNLDEFLSHPRLSTYILSDYALTKGIKFSQKRRLWFLVFDGMRLDTWNEVVKPSLDRRFQVVQEETYLCVLPSVTDIARISLLAGKPPSKWEGYDRTFTSDHNILASRCLGLSKEDGRKTLRIIVASETDYGQRKLDLDVKPYNILIYNLSDDWIHTFRGDIEQLNETIRGMLERVIIPDIEGRIGEEDMVIVTSDHGFIELSRENEIEVKSKDQYQVTFRYLKDMSHPEGLIVRFAQPPQYCVAKGRKWFGREKGKFSRYSHGGISLDEMVVPAALLKKITKPRIEIVLDKIPDLIEGLEDTEFQLELLIRNSGNKETGYFLSAELDTGWEESLRGSLTSLEEKSLILGPILSRRSRRLNLTLSYKDAQGKEVKRTYAVPIQVLEKKEKVEIDLSALDKLDKVLEGEDEN